MAKVASLYYSIRMGSGVEKVQSDMSVGLTNMGYEFIHILLENDQAVNTYTGKAFILNKLPSLFGYTSTRLSRLYLAYQTAKICKREKVDILIGQDHHCGVSGLSKLFGFRGKTIAAIHGTTSFFKKSYIYTLRVKTLLKIHNKIILISKEEYNRFLTEYHFPKDTLSLIYNGINTDTESLQKEKVEDILFDKFTFISIGRLEAVKRQDSLIQAFDLFHTKHPDSQLIILGEGSLRKYLEEKISGLKSNKNIHLLGNKENIYKYLKKSNCFVLTSKSEGFPIVLIEAITTGIPIISVDCPTGPKELLAPESLGKEIHGIQKTKFGWIVGTEDVVNNIAGAMEAYYNSKDIIYDTNIFKTKFSLENTIAQWDIVLKSLLQK